MNELIEYVILAAIIFIVFKAAKSAAATREEIKLRAQALLEEDLNSKFEDWCVNPTDENREELLKAMDRYFYG